MATPVFIVPWPPTAPARKIRLIMELRRSGIADTETWPWKLDAKLGDDVRVEGLAEALEEAEKNIEIIPPVPQVAPMP